ncbi:hypothetical protein [Egicoccus halophilus]|uniref:Uncharacterized protein n=1 Tax=Egicoccus halophilus TaxID=1670830 RepID=A0A8J3AC05_9ACTN|nr:hypothetical protein [Egicoccus halophilus]GGI07984.1 hypothetical protein GCM10011354_26810 [Egicoccus halophilus]
MPDRAQVRAEARHYKTELLGQMFGPGADAPAVAAAAGAPLRLPRAGNVVGVGYGAKVVGSAIAEDLAVRVYVRAKRPVRELTRAEQVPTEVDGRPTDVVVVGDLRALRDPVDCGVSIGHVDVTAGTLGCLVTLADAPGERFVLSNNHVLADSDRATPGDAIVQPASMDGGDPDDPIGVLHAAVPLRRDEGNLVDAAVARLFDPASVRPRIAHIGAPVPPVAEAALYQSVRKHGRTTEHTVGVVVDVAADIEVRFDTRTLSFLDQLAVVGIGGDDFSDGGDSGSLIVDAVTRQPVALLFAGGGGVTFGNAIGEVLAALDAQVVGEAAT